MTFLVGMRQNTALIASNNFSISLMTSITFLWTFNVFHFVFNIFTLDCLIDNTPSSHWLIFRFLFSPRIFLFQPPRLLIIGESFKPRKTFWNNILMLTFLRSRKRNDLACIVFCFVNFCKGANTLSCFVT